MSIVALGLVSYLSFLTNLDPIILRAIAVGIMIVFMLLNIRSVGGSSIVQIVLTVLKILPFIIVIGLGLFFIKENFISGEIQEFSEVANSSQPWLLTIFTAIAATTFSYDGMYAPTYMAGEVKNPKKIMPIAFIIIALVVVILYFALSFVSVGLLSTDQIAQSSAPIAEVASQIPIIGSLAETTVAIMAVLVIIGSLASVTMYQPRLGYSMAKDGLFFKVFARVHPKYKSPYAAIIIYCSYSIILTFVGNLSDLLGYFTLITLLRNFATFGTIFFLRKKESYKPSYKAPGGLACPIISCLITGLLFIGVFINDPIPSLIVILVLAVTGIIAYRIFKKMGYSSLDQY